jgi:hemolysin activation/secretion protein
LYDLGGARSVRGLRENEFASDRTVVLRAELRYLPDRQSRIYPFFDCGAFVHQGRWRFISGCGAGVRAATRAGVLGLDYGVAVGEHPLQGKVHLSFETGF